MIYPLGHKATCFAGQYAGVLDNMTAQAGRESVDNVPLDLYGYDLDTGFASKKTVLGYKGAISNLPTIGGDYAIPLVGPGYVVTKTDVNGHLVEADRPITELVAYFNKEAARLEDISSSVVHTTITVYEEASDIESKAEAK